MNKRIIAGIAALGIALSGGAIAAAPAQGAPSPTITVATEGTYAPFSFHKGTRLTGYDVDVFNAVAKKAGYTPKWVETTWDGIFAGLDSKRWQAIANQVTITPERLAKYSFTKPNTVSNYVVITKKDDASVSKVQDISGKTAAQSATSSFAEEAKKYGANIQTVEGFTQAITLLQQGRVDVTLNDSLAAWNYLRTTPNSGVKVAATFGSPSKQAFVFPKGTPYAAKFNAALAALQKDGTIAAIGKKYFGRDVSK